MKLEGLIEISNPYTVYTKFKKIFPRDSEIKISTRKNKKYMIYDPNIKKWFYFGSTMTDYTFRRDLQRRLKFKTRNRRWADADIYTPAYASYYLLW